MTTCHDIYGYDDEAASDRRIVVGVDGSAASQAALRWAIDEAHATSARVEAVLVYPPNPYLNFAFGDYPAVTGAPYDQFRRDALDQLRQTTAAVVRPEDRLRVELALAADNAPARALTRHAERADLLVVGGSRHHGLGVLLGSTASSCVRHATCPVVVVPATVEAVHPDDSVRTVERRSVSV
jgi:nucleotide-binding universal stress UspA family protein